MKKACSFMMGLLLHYAVFSQVPFSGGYTPPAYADVDTTFNHYVNNIFGLLEPGRVSTGLLADYAFEFTDPRIYNGASLHDSTLVEQGIYSELYATLYSARFNNTVTGMRHPEVHDSLCYIARQREVITLSGLLFNYNTISPTAQNDGKIQTVNGRLQDRYISGVWQNPYLLQTAVAISPSVIRYNLTYGSVLLPANLFQSNISSMVSGIQWDADDGAGYRAVSFGVPVLFNYADTGWKHWKFRIALTDSRVLYSHSKIFINNTSNMAGSGGVSARGTADRRKIVTAVESYGGLLGVADLVISYRNANDMVLRKPLIIAEGLDAGWITSPEEPEGDNTFSSFILSVSNSGSTTLVNHIGNFFNGSLSSEYDIVYVNWRNGTDWLQRNAYVLEAVIRWVNANKQPLAGVRQPNVVLGSSMGGVIARMALGRMDRGEGPLNGSGGFPAHETSLYISLDAPHQGANVPLGFQAAARHAFRMYLRLGAETVSTVEIVQTIASAFGAGFPSPLKTLLLADQPAAKQLLSNRIDIFFNADNSTHQSFMNELRTTWHYPASTRNVAVSNGSECAIGQEFTAGSSIIYHNRTTSTRVIGDIISLMIAPVAKGLGTLTGGYGPYFAALSIPGNNKISLTLDVKSVANGGGNQVYYGKISYTKKVLWLVPVTVNIANRTYNAPSGLLPIDTYPGGFYTLSMDDQPGSISQDWMFTYDNSFSIRRRFAFIHTTSALDIGEGATPITNAQYTAHYPSGATLASPYYTPFNNYSAAFHTNPFTVSKIHNGAIVWQFQSSGDEPHEGLYLRTANWLAQELNGAVGANCAGLCSSVSISGNDKFCTTSTPYTIPGLPPGATVTWSASPSGIVTINTPNAVQTTLTKTGNGNVTLSASISSLCNPTPVVVSKNIYAGLPAFNGPAVYYTEYGGPYPLLLSFPHGNHPIPNEICERYGGSTDINIIGATSLVWSKTDQSSGASVTWSQDSYNDLHFWIHDAGDWAAFKLTYGNQCGSGNVTYKFKAITCNPYPPHSDIVTGNQFTIAPNPASGSITISQNSKSTLSKTETGKTGIIQVSITDVSGIVKKQQQFAANTTNMKMDVSALAPGTYFVLISNGGIPETQQLFIYR